MRMLKGTIGAIGLTYLMAIHTGCDQQELEDMTLPDREGNTHTIEMVFTGVKEDYGDILTKATAEWEEGDQLYLTFAVGSNQTPGKAVYTGGKWKLTYEGELATGQQNSCVVRYFTDCASQTAGIVTLKPSSAVYEAENGEYSYTDGVLTVNAGLKPKYGRLRFQGNAGETINVNGISYNGTYSPLTGKFTTKSTPMNLTVEADGYTPYIYGNFKGSNKSIALISTESAYTRYFTSDILAAGQSGYMAIPTIENHNNWRTGLYVQVTDAITFRMIPVSGHEGGLYLLGETEVTQQLYHYIDGSTAAYPNKASSYNSYQNATTFMDKLSNTTGYTFCLPTYSQWLFAAKGGTASQGYTYAGSNDINEVAWYATNANELKEVKTMAPNELGFYDMSGNVSEWTSTLQNEAYKGSAIRAGGSYTDTPENCTVTSYAYEETNYLTNKSYGFGMRICLNVQFN